MDKLADFFTSLTLYDFFAYLLTGLPVMLGMLIFGWTWFAPQGIPRLATPSGYVVSVVLLVAYILGHAVQTLSYRIFGNPRPSAEGLDVLLKRRIRDEFQLDKDPDERMMTRYAKDLALRRFQFSLPALRDIYEYRVGYYRGMTLALAILAISLPVRALASPTQVELGDNTVAVPDGSLYAMTAVVFGVALAHYSRFRLFYGLQYRLDVIAVVWPEREPGEDGKPNSQ